MIIRVPLTGTVLAEHPLSGDPDDPIRPVELNPGNVSWTLVSVDLEDESMMIDVRPNDEIEEEVEPGKWVSRKATLAEKAQALEHIRGRSLERMSKQALYALSGSPALKNPFKEMLEQ